MLILSHYNVELSVSVVRELMKAQMRMKSKVPYAGKPKRTPEDTEAVRQRNTMRMAYTVWKLKLRLALAAKVELGQQGRKALSNQLASAGVIIRTNHPPSLFPSQSGIWWPCRI